MRLFVDQLTNIDSSYLDPKRGVVGETWLVDLELSGDLDPQGMVFDFGHVKKRIKAVIDDVADHRLIVPVASSAISGSKGDWRLQLENGGEIHHRGPAESVCALASPTVTAEALRKHLIAPVNAVVPSNVSEVRLHLYHEDTADEAYYHYSHGLKHHDGNCQRIAHGHRSRIQIWRDGERDRALEATVARDWRDVYLVTREDIVSQEQGKLSCAYRAAQGIFSLSLPAAHCDILETDSTVERIAQHLCTRIARQYPGERISVRAFEGLNKGAISDSDARAHS